MWPLAVVVGRVGAEHVFEVAAVEDQQPVETLGADGADEALGVGVRLWRPDRCSDHLIPSLRKTSSKARAELAVAVVDQEPRLLEVAAEAEVARLLVTQAPVGLVVQPASWTRRLASSMKNKT